MTVLLLALLGIWGIGEVFVGIFWIAVALLMLIHGIFEAWICADDRDGRNP